MAGSYVSPLSLHNPASGQSPPATWGDAVNAALDYFDSLISDAGFTSYTPTVAQGATGNIAKTVNYSKYTRHGKKLSWIARLSITGTGTAASNITVTMPVGEVSNADLISGIFVVYDQSANLPYHGACVVASNDTVFGLRDSSAGNFGIGLTPSFALANGDIIWFSTFYETA